MQDGDGEDCEGSDGKEGDLEPSHHIEAAAEFAEKIILKSAIVNLFRNSCYLHVQCDHGDHLESKASREV